MKQLSRNLAVVSNVVDLMKLWGSPAILLFVLAISAAEPSLDPMPVCDAVAAASDYQGKAIAILGRYSFRKTGRWLDEESCGKGAERAMILLKADAESAPKPPEPLSLNEDSLEKKLISMKRHTSLEKFRFGSSDYDRWAVVFGRLETGVQQKSQLVYRGDGAVFFFVDQ